MRVEINKRIVDVPEDVATLGQLLEAEALAGPGRAVAVDGRLVPRADHGSFLLEDGMVITVIRAFCGG